MEVARLQRVINDVSIWAFVRAKQVIQKNEATLVTLFGFAVLTFGLHDIVYAGQGRGAGSGFNGEKFDETCQAILSLFEGEFGALLAAAAGMGAIIASAMGGFKMAWSLLVVSVGSFILREYKDLFFNGDCG